MAVLSAVCPFGFFLSKQGNCDRIIAVGLLISGPSSYKKYFLGLSDNVTYFVKQVDGADVSTYHYKLIFKPSVIVPDVSVK